MASSAIRFVAGTKKSPLGTLYLQCHVKPGASRVREGVTAVTDATVELCVSAQAKEGEANKAVVKLLSGVCVLFFFFLFLRSEAFPNRAAGAYQGLRSSVATIC